MAVCCFCISLSLTVNHTDGLAQLHSQWNFNEIHLRCSIRAIGTILIYMNHDDLAHRQHIRIGFAEIRGARALDNIEMQQRNQTGHTVGPTG